MDTRILEEIGLSKDEIRTYLALLRFGSVTATKIASETNIYRTNVYRLLDSLIGRGLASSVLKNNVRYYSAASPKKILEDEERKQKELKKLIPKLEEISNLETEEFKVDVFKGQQGLIAVLKYIIREGKDYVVFGDEGQFQTIFPILMKQFLRDVSKSNIHEIILSKESMRDEIFVTKKNSKIRYLPDNFFSPTNTLVFGGYIAIFFWDEPYRVILIRSKSMAESYRSYFLGLWEIAKD